MKIFDKTQFNEKKTVNSVLLITQNLMVRNLHKIFKILYFSDRDHLSTYGRPITGDTYIAMKAGPVPGNLCDIFKRISGNKKFKQVADFSNSFKVVDSKYVNPIISPNLKALSKTDLNFLNKNMAIYGNMAWKQIRQVSRDYAWKNTAKGRLIKVDDILIEAGSDASYLDYLKLRDSIHKSF